MDPFTFSDALAQVTGIARAKLPATLQGRLDTALGLIAEHAVEIPLDDSPALVHSRTRQGVVHTVARQCTCEDASYQAPDGLCAHRLAVGLTRKAAEVLRAHPDAQEPVVLDLEPQLLAALPPVPHVEVPVIASTVLTIEGRCVEVKLCDTDDTRLLARLTHLLQQYPVAATAPVPHGDGWCSVHEVQMRRNEGKAGGQGWWSHKTADGTWCKGK